MTASRPGSANCPTMEYHWNEHKSYATPLMTTYESKRWRNQWPGASDPNPVVIQNEEAFVYKVQHWVGQAKCNRRSTMIGNDTCIFETTTEAINNSNRDLPHLLLAALDMRTTGNVVVKGKRLAKLNPSIVYLSGATLYSCGICTPHRRGCVHN